MFDSTFCGKLQCRHVEMTLTRYFWVNSLSSCFASIRSSKSFYLTLLRPRKICQGGDEVLHLLGHPPRLQLLQLHQHQALPVVLWKDPDYSHPVKKSLAISDELENLDQSVLGHVGLEHAPMAGCVVLGQDQHHLHFSEFIFENHFLLAFLVDYTRMLRC